MDISAMGAMSPAHAMSGASPAMPPQQKMANLFDKIDTSGSGAISQAQFQQAFQAMNPPPNAKSLGANNLFSLLDPNGTGQVSKSDFVNKMTEIMSQLRSGQTPTASSLQASAANTQTLNASLNALNGLGKDNDGDADGSNKYGVLGSAINAKA